MPISALPTPPSRSDSPQDFSDRADALLGALPGFVTEANALQSDVNAKEASASSHATIATDKAAEAQGHATTASTKASEAAAAAVAAAAAASNAEIAFDSFDDKYLGSKASDPLTDNDGDALLVGALYWNTTVGAVRVWNGSAWLSMAADASIVDFQQAGTGAIVRTAQDKMREWVSVKDFGAVGDGVTDDTAAINAAFNALKAAGGGDLIFPTGDYRFNLDVSGVNPHMQWIGQGSVTFRPYLAAPDREWIIFANNKTPGVTGSASGTNITFRNITFTGRFVGDADPNYGRVAACVWLQSSWAAFYDCTFLYGISAGFYGMYGQYNEFYECTFGANVSGAASAGCLLDSNTDAEAANENRLINCRFNTNKNGLVIKGGLGNRIVGCQFQNTVAGGLGALVLVADSTGFGTTNNWISGNYFEINSRDVHIEAAPGQTFEGNIFLPGTIYTTHCYDLRFIGNTNYGGAAITDFNHPAGNTDVASLTWIGNNFDPDIAGLTHVGPTRLNIENAQTRQRRNDNLLTSTGQSAGLAVNFIPDWCGVKAAVPKSTATDIFKIVQETSGSNNSRVAVFTVELFLWDDDASVSQYGYSGHTQRFSVLISNNTTGAPQVFIVQETSGVDVGLNTGFQAPGSVTLTSTVSGDSVTFRVSWSGSGTGSGGMAQQAVSYIVRGAGTHGFSMVRL